MRLFDDQAFQKRPRIESASGPHVGNQRQHCLREVEASRFYRKVEVGYHGIQMQLADQRRSDKVFEKQVAGSVQEMEQLDYSRVQMAGKERSRNAQMSLELL